MGSRSFGGTYGGRRGRTRHVGLLVSILFLFYETLAVTYVSDSTISSIKVYEVKMLAYWQFGDSRALNSSLDENIADFITLSQELGYRARAECRIFKR